MTLETLRFLRGLIDQTTISGGAPNFDDAVKIVSAARRELDAEIAAAEQAS